MDYDRRKHPHLKFLAGLSKKELYDYALQQSIDSTTGLLRRDAFYYALTRLPDEAFPASLLAIDVVDFKRINDRYGYARGDQALGMVGKAIRDSIRREDLATRIGGDEFGVITTPELLLPLRDRIDHRLSLLRPEYDGLALQVRYGHVPMPDANGVDTAIDLALKKAYREIPSGRSMLIAP